MFVTGVHNFPNPVPWKLLLKRGILITYSQDNSSIIGRGKTFRNLGNFILPLFRATMKFIPW